MPGPAVVVDHDPGWARLAARCLGEVRAALSAYHRCEYDHIGSTSVSGLAAKPSIDLQVRMPELPALDELAVLLAPIGFEPARGSRPDSPGVHRDTPRPGARHLSALHEKRLFYAPGRDVILHIRRADSPFARFVLDFRDWLRHHPAEAARYGQLKRELAERHAHEPDYDNYTRAKSVYFTEIEPRLSAWARR